MGRQHHDIGYQKTLKRKREKAQQRAVRDAELDAKRGKR